MARVLSTALVLALLAATALAFVLTESAKLEKSPIYATRLPDPIFSPNGTLHPEADLSFRLRKTERVEVWIEDKGGHRQRTLLAPLHKAADLLYGSALVADRYAAIRPFFDGHEQQVVEPVPAVSPDNPMPLP